MLSCLGIAKVDEQITAELEVLMRDYKQECDKFEAANKILQQRENEVKNKEDELKKQRSKILKDKDKLELKKRAVLLVVHLKNLMLFPFDASFHICHRTIKLSYMNALLFSMLV